MSYGKNYLTYPMAYMNISQSYNDSYSHASHNTGSPKDYPIDDCGIDSGRSAFYCPCDQMEIVRFRTEGTNTIWLKSTSPVVTPSGTFNVVIMIEHPNDSDFSGKYDGQKFLRDEIIVYEGTDGWATGNHLHISVGSGDYTGNGWVKNSKGSWVLQTTGRSLKPEEAFYIDSNKTTVGNRAGINFSYLPSNAYEAPAPAPAEGQKQITIINEDSYNQATYSYENISSDASSFSYVASIGTPGVEGKKFLGVGQKYDYQPIMWPGDTYEFNLADYPDNKIELVNIYETLGSGLWACKEELVEENGKPHLKKRMYKIKKIWCYLEKNGCWRTIIPYVYQETVHTVDGKQYLKKYWIPIREKGD